MSAPVIAGLAGLAVGTVLGKAPAKKPKPTTSSSSSVTPTTCFSDVQCGPGKVCSSGRCTTPCVIL